MQFLTLGAGVRSLGMGGAGAASHDSASPHWNPAGIGALDHHEVSLMNGRWLEDFRYQTFAYAGPLTRTWSAGLGVARLSRSDVAAYDDGGQAAGSFGVSDTAASLTLAADTGSWARSPDRFYAGLSAKYVGEDLGAKKVSGYAADGGVVVVPYRRAASRFLDRFEVGASFHNLGPAVKYDKEKSRLPALYRVGFSARGWSRGLLLAADYEKPADDPGSVRSGVEVEVLDALAFRGGYRWALKDNQRTLQAGYHVGVGFQLGAVAVDYAFAPYLKTEDAHFLGIRWSFGSSLRLEQVERRMSEHFRAAEKAYKRKDFARAQKELGYVLAVDPSHDGARRLQAENQKQLASLRVERQLALGKRQLASADYSLAREQFQAVLDAFPSHAEAAQLLVEADRRIQDQVKERRDALSGQAEEFYKQNNFQDAIDLWEKVLLLDPGNAAVTASLEKARAKLEEQKRLLAAAEESRNLEKGWAALNQKKADKAREVAEEVLKQNPSSEGAQTLLAQANSRLADDRLAEARRFLQKGDRRRAFAALREAQTLDPRNKIVQDLLGETRKAVVQAGREEALNLYEQKKYKEALAKLNDLLEVDPSASDLAGYRDETRRRLAELNQAEVERLNREGLKAYDEGRLKDAVRYWKEVLEIAPDHVNARRNLERAQQQIKE